jgi:hypothetical protein
MWYISSPVQPRRVLLGSSGGFGIGVGDGGCGGSFCIISHHTTLVCHHSSDPSSFSSSVEEARANESEKQYQAGSYSKTKSNVTSGI